MNRSLLASMLMTLAIAACSKQEPPAPAAPKAEAPAAAPAPTADGGGQQNYPPNTGKLVQVMHAGGYTYGEVEGPNGQRIWIAGGHIEAQPGDLVQWGQFAVMHNFTAKSINKTFQDILFVNSWGKLDGPMAQVAAHGAPQGHPATGGQGGGGAVAAGAAHSGVVKSTTTAGGYTYLEVEQDGQTTWIAAPETSVKVGDTVNWTGGMTMRNFTAKSLDRTFDQIVFAGGVSVQ